MKRRPVFRAEHRGVLPLWMMDREEPLNGRRGLWRDGDGPRLARLGHRRGDGHKEGEQVEVLRPELEAFSRSRPTVKREQHEGVVSNPCECLTVGKPKERGEGIVLYVDDTVHGAALL